MKVRIRTAGALIHSMPSGEDVIEGEAFTIRSLIEALAKKFGPGLEAELLDGEEIKEGLCMLVNGRNILSMPERYETFLQDGDEVFVTVLVSGG